MIPLNDINPKRSKSKSKQKATTNLPQTRSETQPPSFEITIDKKSPLNYLLETQLKPKLDKIQKVYSEQIDFHQDIIQIRKKLVTANTLPNSRFGEDEDPMIMIAPTDLHQKIDNFMENMVYNPINEKSKSQKRIWITGSSGIGKSAAILTNVVKKRRSNSNPNKIILLHMILTEVYLNDFFYSFFNDLLYAIFPFIDDKTFPSCPKGLEKSGSPMIDWLLYLLFDFKTNLDLEALRRFLPAVNDYCSLKGLKFVIIIDQTNIFQRQRQNKKIDESVEKFVHQLIVGKYSDKVVISSSNNNEDLDSDISAPNLKDFVFEAHMEGFLKKEQIKQWLLKKFAFNYNDDQIDELCEATGFIPLEIWEFCKINFDNFEEKLNEYMRSRSNTIRDDVENFYLQKTSSMPEWKSIFYYDFFVRLDTGATLNNTNHRLHIDRKYMFVENEKLRSFGPLAKQVIHQYYTKKILEYEKSQNLGISIYLIYLNLYKITDEKNDASLKGFLLEKLLINQLLKKKDEIISLNCLTGKGETSKISLNFSEIVFFKQGIDDNNIYFFHDTLFIPHKYNNPFVDFYYYNKNENSLYAFQITLSILTHKNSDVLFKISQQYENLIEKKKIAKVIFVWLTDKIDNNETKLISKQFIDPKKFIDAEKAKEQRNKTKKKGEKMEKLKKKSEKPKDIDSWIMSARLNDQTWKFN